MEPATEFDVVVIGGGPGGYGTALYGASAGLSVAIVEMAEMGGTCLNRGCIPVKSFLETAAVHRHVAHAGDFGIIHQRRFDLRLDARVVDELSGASMPIIARATAQSARRAKKTQRGHYTRHYFFHPIPFLEINHEAGV